MSVGNVDYSATLSERRRARRETGSAGSDQWEETLRLQASEHAFPQLNPDQGAAAHGSDITRSIPGRRSGKPAHDVNRGGRSRSPRSEGRWGVPRQVDGEGDGMNAPAGCVHPGFGPRWRLRGVGGGGDGGRFPDPELHDGTRRVPRDVVTTHWLSRITICGPEVEPHHTEGRHTPPARDFAQRPGPSRRLSGLDGSCCPHLAGVEGVLGQGISLSPFHLPNLIAPSPPYPFTQIPSQFAANYSPPTKEKRVRFPAGSLQGFSHVEWRRTVLLVCEFSRGDPFPPAFAFQRCSIITSLHPHRLSRPRPTEYVGEFERCLAGEVFSADIGVIWRDRIDEMKWRGKQEIHGENPWSPATSASFPHMRKSDLVSVDGKAAKNEICRSGDQEGGSKRRGRGLHLEQPRGRGGVVDRLLASHQGEPGSIPDGFAPGSSHVGITASRRVFLRISCFPAPPFRRCSMPTSLHPHRLSRPRCQEPPKSEIN
ncbi:hypothetical protein PR048_032648 [Dryococelus australis]|uniref:Uncharacterized protein n=1 Tax=Dryococelus australis TaxID=614101 RepID=A0ABQ9G5S5_9NEOP|nr:hypothetical protein PR048_032648 [Dryococelus australis]